MFATIIVLFFILLVILAVKGSYMSPYWDEETTTTTTTTIETPNVFGGLQRQLEGGQFFVIDPVDQKKTWLNSNDDMYEDAGGKVWRLV